MRRKKNTTYEYASVFGPVKWFSAAERQSRNLNNKYSIVTQTHKRPKTQSQTLTRYKTQFRIENQSNSCKYSKRARLNQKRCRNKTFENWISLRRNWKAFVTEMKIVRGWKRTKTRLPGSEFKLRNLSFQWLGSCVLCVVCATPSPLL